MRKFILLCMMLVIVTGCTSHSEDLDIPAESAAIPSEANIQPNDESTIQPDQQSIDEVGGFPQIPPSERLPEELVQIVSANREAFFKPATDDAVAVAKGYRTTDLDHEIDAKIAEMLRQAKNQTDATSPETLTHEQVLREVDYLFDVLKYGYSLYTYFGGDAVFEATKQLIATKLSVTSDPISVDDYINKLIAPCLRAVIADNHFSIGNQAIGTGQKSLYISDELYFTKSGDDYITTIDGKKYRLPSEEMQNFFLPTLTKDGEVALTAGLMSDQERAYINVKFKLENVITGEVTEYAERCTVASNDYVHDLSDGMYTLGNKNGIPILDNRSLYPMNEDDEAKLLEFVNTGNTLRKEPLLILDLRANGGGMANYAYNWILRYSYNSPESGFFLNTSLITQTAKEINEYARDFAAPGSFWSDMRFVPPKKIYNKNLVIVLIDNYVGSSGECFVAYLSQMENVVFVGTSTMGVLTAGNIGTTILPESKLEARFGVNYNIKPDLSAFEGMGFQPDLWVAPGESLERVLKFVERYGLDGK